MRAGEIGFYIIAACFALGIALPQRGSALATALFIAIAAFAFLVALEGAQGVLFPPAMPKRRVSQL